MWVEGMSKNVVVDASVALSWLLPGEETNNTLSLRDYAAASSDVNLFVPPIFWYEIANVLWVAVKREQITQPQAIDGIKALQEFHFYMSITDPIDNISISFTQDIAVYDAAYLNWRQRMSSPTFANKSLHPISRRPPLLPADRISTTE